MCEAERTPCTSRATRFLRINFIRIKFAILVALLMAASATRAAASTYVVYVPLDDPAYEELDTLSGLGFIQTYINEIKPIARVEVARLILEAESQEQSGQASAPLAASLIRSLRLEFGEEVRWIEQNSEDNQPATLHPLQRIEGQYLFSSGVRRSWSSGPSSEIHAQEATPLLPNADGVPTAPGSNEIVRLSGWGGVGGFLTVYGEGGMAGPVTRSIPGTNRFRLFGAAAVLSLGNTAVSFGQEELDWGLGRFGSLSQGNNAQSFPALRVQNIHPYLMPGFLKYLGQTRHQIVVGQLDGSRTFAHPWIAGQAISFKPFPFFEFGLNHMVMLGGKGNDNYSFPGFLGRLTGLATGNPKGADTNTRVGAYFKLIVPQLRRTEFYYEILGEDYFQPFGGNTFPLKTPFKAPSYTFGVYAPQLTADGLTDAGAEYTLLDARYSTHEDSLYWTFQNNFMGDALGPAGWHVNAKVGRWIDYQTKISPEIFFERRSLHPFAPASTLVSNENGFGAAINLLHIPFRLQSSADSLGQISARASVEYVQHVNYSTTNSVRALLLLSFGFTPPWPSLKWQ